MELKLSGENDDNSIKQKPYYDLQFKGRELMGNQVYQEGDYKIYKVGQNFVVHNANYDFSDKHSHIRNFNAAKSVVHMACQKILPRNYSNYLLVSLMRISDDEGYVGKIKCLMEVRRQKGQKLRYCNTA